MTRRRQPHSRFARWAAPPSALAPLDGLSVGARDSLMCGAWSGGQLVSDYSAAWVTAKSGSTSEGFKSLAELVAWEPGTVRRLTALMDQSGNGRYIPGVGLDANLGVLVGADDVPIFDVNGTTLAVKVPQQSAAPYVRNDTLGLPLDTAAVSIFWNQRKDPYSYGWVFSEDLEGGWWPYYAYLNAAVAALVSWPTTSPSDPAAQIYYDEPAKLSGATWYGIVKPAGATASTARYYADGVVLSTVFPDIPPGGVISLAGSNQFAWLPYPYGDGGPGSYQKGSAFLAFSSEITGADLAIVNAFFASLGTPP